MKRSLTPSFRSLLASVPAILLIASPLSGVRAEDSSVTGKESLVRSLQAPPAVRSFAPTSSTRSGYATKETTGGGKRSIAIVEVSVASQANVSLQSIRFKLDSTEPLNQTSWNQLNELAAALKELSGEGGAFLIEGHTCSLGEADHNNELSLARAEFIRDYLAGKGVPLRALKAIGCGEAEAEHDHVTPNSSESVLASYRKVMVHRIAE